VLFRIHGYRSGLQHPCLGWSMNARPGRYQPGPAFNDPWQLADGVVMRGNGSSIAAAFAGRTGVGGSISPVFNGWRRYTLCYDDLLKTGSDTGGPGR
jgi:hypothetical protein